MTVGLAGGASGGPARGYLSCVNSGQPDTEQPDDGELADNADEEPVNDTEARYGENESPA